MDINTAVMLGVLVLLIAVSWFMQGGEGMIDGAKSSAKIVTNIWPMLLLAFGIAGFLQVVVPNNLISQYLGPASGWKYCP